MRLSRIGGNIVLDIHDNGKGISTADMSKPKSFGLRGIRERVLSLAGEFSITAADIGGTQLSLKIPEHASAESARYDEHQREQQREPQRKLF